MDIPRRAGLAALAALAANGLYLLFSAVLGLLVAALVGAALGYALRGGGGAGIAQGGARLARRAPAPAVPTPPSEFTAAVEELRRLARRCEPEARAPLLRIARHLSVLSRAELPDTETRREREIAEELRAGLSLLRRRGGTVAPEAVAPLLALAETLERASAEARRTREHAFAGQVRALVSDLRPD
ncbi:hypothetical protein [Mangrovicoccus algicola]|uniref:Uncharacterized protein n=1 Tax=Mangrovicoccus algicola TaxID=2771008 RepID=A0A8J6Z0U9_9RHOB|nr:hypothetical protein [Mangrovicoccus algicola]MBE3639396.1 hypothetical protein [Mangrovicoccus algicola]